MKTPKFLLIILFAFPTSLFSQELTGLWTGTLENDSTNRKQDYELALSEYRGKVTGYSYTTFISNDTFYYSIKRLKATKQDSIWIVEDDKMVANNFPERAAKGVRQINTFRLNKLDSSWKMDGTWRTNQTKKYYSLTGTMQMKEEPNQRKSNLIAHLEELNLQNTVAFYQPEKKVYFQDKLPEPAIVKKEEQPREKKSITQPEKPKEVVAKSNTIITEPKKKSEVAVQKEETQLVKSIPEEENPVVKTEPKKKPEIAVQKEEAQLVKSIPEKESPVVKTSPPITKEVKTQISNVPEKKLPEQQKKVETTVVAKTKIETKIDLPTVEKKEAQPLPAKKDEVAANISLPTLVSNRKSETIERIFFKSDSLVLTLYDNGVVDGDTVSVFLNGQNIIDKQRLKTVATRKTIYIPVHADSMQLVLFAENLGSIPPNTGLLVIRDGDETYQVRFSADMQKNAAIVFRRKQPQ